MMNEKEILENNKLIAKFMGREVHTDGIGWFDEKFKVINGYEKSWNLLMPVIEKIESIGYSVNIIQNNCTIRGAVMGDRNIYAKHVGYSETKIESCCKAVIKFIKWYNENK